MQSRFANDATPCITIYAQGGGHTYVTSFPADQCVAALDSLRGQVTCGSLIPEHAVELARIVEHVGYAQIRDAQ